MTIVSAFFDALNNINVTYEDGSIKNIPDAIGNRDRIELQEWIDAEPFSHKIEPYVVLVTGDDVNLERTRRITVGATFGGVYVTGSDDDARNLTNLAFGASLRISSGDNTTLTSFRDGNNVLHDLTPLQVLGLWQQSAAYVSNVYSFSWAIKAISPIPLDFINDKYWTA